MAYTLQIAPEDCTGCGLCIQACPVKDKTDPKRRAINMEDQRRAASFRGSQLGLLPLPARIRPQQACPPDQVKDLQLLPAVVRVLGRVLGVRRDALRQTAHAVVRRSCRDRQRHRMLVDLRRQPADDALCDESRRSRSVRGPIRCSKTMPSSVSACGWRSISRPQYARELVTALRRARSARTWPRNSSRPISPMKPASSRSATRIAELKTRVNEWLASAQRQRAGACRDLLAVADSLGQEERLDSRRRRLGLRHRLRRPRPRHGLRPQRQYPGPRYRGLLQHRRTVLEVHASRRRGEVRRRRQAVGQEGPGHDGGQPTATAMSPASPWDRATCKP